MTSHGNIVDKGPDLSVLLAFGDCEESIGRRVGAWAERLGALGRSFEIIAVNEGSRDNSMAVLALLASRIPELRVVGRDAAGRAFARGVVEARGSIILLARCHADEDASLPSIIPLGWALGRLDHACDGVVVRGRFVVARKAAALACLLRGRGATAGFEAWFERTAAPSLRLHVVGTRRAPAGPLAPLRRLILALGMSR